MSTYTPLKISQLIQNQYRDRSSEALALIGFDGFTDTISSAVDRWECGAAKKMEHMAQFGERVLAAAGKSCNIELQTDEKRMGGNAPLLAHALLSLEEAVHFVGTIGEREVEPLFQPLAKRAQTCTTLGASGHTDAVEFADGKVLLGRTAAMEHVNYQNLLEQVGHKTLSQLLDRSTLVATVNWTMCPHLSALWEELIAHHLPSPSTTQQRWWFVDLADPAKRSDEDLEQALQILHRLSPTYRLVLGLNLSEAEQVLRLSCSSPPSSDLEELAQQIYSYHPFNQIVLHSKGKKVAAIANEDGSASLSAPLVAAPKISTGAGDHFNAGFCHGLLHHLTPNEALYLAVGTSGFYVRNGLSPTRKELVNFIQEWHHHPSTSTT